MDIMQIVQPVFSGIVYIALGLLLLRFSAEIWNVDEESFQQTRLPRDRSTTFGLGVALATVFVLRSLYDMSLFIPKDPIKLHEFPPLHWDDALFYALAEVLPMALALALTAEAPPEDGFQGVCYRSFRCGRVYAHMIAACGATCCPANLEEYASWRRRRREALAKHFGGMLRRAAGVDADAGGIPNVPSSKLHWVRENSQQFSVVSSGSTIDAPKRRHPPGKSRAHVSNVQQLRPPGLPNYSLNSSNEMLVDNIGNSTAPELGIPMGHNGNAPPSVNRAMQ